MPDFWPATSMRRPLGSVTRIGDAPKSKSGPFGLAVGFVRQTARGGVGVLLGHLLGPEDLARVEIHREERIAHRRRRVAVVVASGDVEAIQLGINSRRRPHRSTGWTIELRADGVLLRRLRLLRDRVALPDLFAGCRIECDDAPAELAALVRGHGAGGFFSRCDTNVDASVVIASASR